MRNQKQQEEKNKCARWLREVKYNSRILKIYSSYIKDEDIGVLENEK